MSLWSILRFHLSAVGWPYIPWFSSLCHDWGSCATGSESTTGQAKPEYAQWVFVDRLSQAGVRSIQQRWRSTLELIVDDNRYYNIYALLLLLFAKRTVAGRRFVLVRRLVTLDSINVLELGGQTYHNGYKHSFVTSQRKNPLIWYGTATKKAAAQSQKFTRLLMNFC